MISLLLCPAFRKLIFLVNLAYLVSKYALGLISVLLSDESKYFLVNNVGVIECLAIYKTLTNKQCHGNILLHFAMRLNY